MSEQESNASQISEEANSEFQQVVEESPRFRIIAAAIMAGLVIFVPFGLILWLVNSSTLAKERTFAKGDTIITALKISPDGKQVAVGRNAKNVEIYDIETGEVVARLTDHVAPVNSLAYFADGKYLAVGDSETTRIWDVAAKKEIAQLEKDAVKILVIAASPDNRWLATTSSDIPARKDKKFVENKNYPANEIRIWNAENFELHRVLKGHEAVVRSLAFSKENGNQLLSTGKNTAIVWDVDSGEKLEEYEDHFRNLTAGIFHPTKNQIVTAGHDRVINFWDRDSKKKDLVFHGHQGPIVSLAFSPGGRYLFSGAIVMPPSKEEEKGEPVLSETRPLRGWYLSGGFECFQMNQDKSSVWVAEVTPDGRYLLSAGEEKVVNVWPLP